MAVSMVPSVALADTVAPESEATTLDAVSPAADFSAGEVTAAVTNTQAAIDLGQTPEFVKDGSDHYVIPTQVKTGEGTVVDLEIAGQATGSSNKISVPMTEKGNASNKFSVTFFEAGSDGKISTTEVTDHAAIKTYYAVVTATEGEYYNASAAGKVAIKYSIVGKSLQDASLYQIGSDTSDYTDTTFEFDNANIEVSGSGEGNIGVLLNGEPLASSGNWKASVYADGAASTTTAKYAGKYTAVIKGTGDYAGSEVSIKFEISKLDLTTAEVVLTSATAIQKEGSVPGAPVIATINGSSGLDEVIGLAWKSASNGNSYFGKSGTYTYTAQLKSDAELSSAGKSANDIAAIKASVTGTKDVTAEIVKSDAVDIATDAKAAITYNGEALSGTDYDIDYSKGNKAFDLSGLAVAVDGKKLTSDQYTVTVKDAKGNDGDVTKPGKWTVTIEAIPSKCDYAVYGTKTFAVNVTNGTIQAADEVFFKYDGKVAGTSKTVDYDGTNQLDKLQVVVKVGDEEKVLTEGTDYNVEVTLQNTSKKVTEAINTDTYVVTVTSDSWNLTNTNSMSTQFTLTVQKLVPTAVRLAGTKTVYEKQYNSSTNTWSFVEATGLPYTGAEIVPTFEYTTDDSDAIADGTAVWKALPAEAYDLFVSQNNKKVTVKEAGDYRVNLNANTNPDNAEMADNFNLTAYNNTNNSEESYASAAPIDCGTGSNGMFKVINTTFFNDVKPTDWFATAATTGAAMGLFDGDNGGAFLPNKSMTRAEAVQVFSNMAKIDYTNNDLFAKYVQIAEGSFSDVTDTDWYAAAVGWAKSVGLVSGNGDGAFDPNSEISREQLAVMLANYETIFGEYKAADAKVLDSYSDADAVSAWAVDSMAWAVENKIMGANDTLNAQSSISRAEAATMVVNYNQD